MGEAGPVILRLYVAGDGPNSVRARRNLAEALDSVAAELEVIDVFDEPERAMDDRVLVTPTLLRVAPEPVGRLVGDLSDRVALADTLRTERSEA